MIDGPAQDSPTQAGPQGLLGVLRHWLARWSAQGAPNVRAPVQRARGPLRVLVADDDPFNRLLASARLRELGLATVLAADGAEAAALACELHFDLVLMDLQMPILDGLGATRAIRRCEAASLRPAVPVVAFSSTVPAAAVLARHGLDGSLAKPCGDAELEACLLRWCPGYRAPSDGPPVTSPGCTPVPRAPGPGCPSAPPFP